MSKYAIEIQFPNDTDGDPPPLDASGLLVITAHEPCECRKLVLHWRRGTDDDPPTDRTLRQDTLVKWATWEPGQAYQYPFSLDGLADDEKANAARWFVRPEVHLAGVFEPETLLLWTAVPIERATIQQDTDQSLAQATNLPSKDVPASQAEIYASPRTSSTSQPGFWSSLASGEWPCRVSIQLDGNKVLYQPGEEISGRVFIHTFEACQCNRLVLSEQWRTHGSGNRDMGGDRSMVLAQSTTWQANREYVFPFSYHAPTSPFTYHGYHIYLDWYLRATVELPMQTQVFRLIRSPKGETEFLIGNRDGDDPINVAAPSSATDSMSAAILGLFLLLLGCSILLATTEAIVALIFLGFAGYLLYNNAGNFVVELIQYQVAIAVTTLPEQFGLQLAVRLQPRRTVKIDALEMELTIEEQATEGSGSDRKTHKRMVHRGFITERIGQTLKKGRPADFVLQLDLPTGLPTTMDLNNNKVKWTLFIRINTNRSVAWRKRITLKATR